MVDLQAHLDRWRRAVDEILAQAPFRGEPEYLNLPAKYALEGRGKRLRPALFFASVTAVGGNWEGYCSIAAALEVFHTFTLVHDDIMDQDELRRGRPTVHKQFSLEQALLAGDVLLIYAYRLLEKLPAAKLHTALGLFNSTAMEVCWGQARDMELASRGQVTKDQYLTMIDQKTAALLALACQLGGLCGEGTDRQVNALGACGRLLGRAFQLQDDLLELTAEETSMGKSLGSDIVNGKQTWLWLDLNEHLTPAERQRLQSIQQQTLGPEQWKLLRELLQATGTLERAQAQIKEWIKAAREHLSQAALLKPELLSALIDYILKRRS